jgi:hypothetical protein
VPADRGPADRKPVGDLPRGQALLAQHHQDVSPHRVGDRCRHVVHRKRVTTVLRVRQGQGRPGHPPDMANGGCPPATILVPGDPPGDRRQPGHVGRPDRGRCLAWGRCTPPAPRTLAVLRGLGSQTGSQHRQTPGHTRRQPAMVSPASWPIRPRPATSSDAAYAPEKRRSAVRPRP